MNKDSMEFVVYLIHACADRWHMTPKQVYRKLEEAGCIKGYLFQDIPEGHCKSNILLSQTIPPDKARITALHSL